MTPELFSNELRRFNELAPAAATDILKAAESEPSADFRSCWYCNGAHEHLKNRKLLRCFACGVLYLSGFPAIVVMTRSKSKNVTAQDLKEYQEAWED